MIKIKVIIPIVSSVLLFFYCSSPNELMPLYHYIITVESDLPKYSFGGDELGSNTIYPYTLRDRVEGSELSSFVYIYPIIDTGYILFKLYGDTGYGELNPTLKDTLKIITPIDSSRVIFKGNASSDTIFISPW